MPRLVDGKPLTSRSFVDQWARLGGVSSLLSCAQRTGIRIGIWGGCVRNFVLDNRPLSDQRQSIHLIDFLDPFSDIDCVIDRAENWPLIIQAISASVAFAGFVRWEFQTREEALARAGQYARVGAESFVVWHEGFDRERRPRITLEPIQGEVDAFLEAPATRVEPLGPGDRGAQDQAWQNLYDALRMTRYFLQYPAEAGKEGHLNFPDRRRAQNLVMTPEALGVHTQNSLRFELALLDLLLTAHVMSEAIRYLGALSEFLPSVFLERSRIFTAIQRRWYPDFTFMGGLLYRQRNARGLQLRLRMRNEENLSRGGFKSIVPWTSLWSQGPGGEDCCRHEDFKNGVAIVSWRSVDPNVNYSQTQASEFAPVAQIAQHMYYGELPQKATPTEKLFAIPGIVRVGAGLTLRFDHAYLAHLLGRNVRASIGVVNPESVQ